jgi:hypothetical protein
LQHVAQRVQRGPQQHQRIAQQRVGGAAVAAAAAVGEHQQEEAAEAQRGAGVVAAAVAGPQQARAEGHDHWDREAVQQRYAAARGERQQVCL